MSNADITEVIGSFASVFDDTAQQNLSTLRLQEHQSTLRRQEQQERDERKFQHSLRLMEAEFDFHFKKLKLEEDARTLREARRQRVVPDGDPGEKNEHPRGWRGRGRGRGRGQQDGYAANSTA